MRNIISKILKNLIIPILFMAHNPKWPPNQGHTHSVVQIESLIDTKLFVFAQGFKTGIVF